MFDLLMVVRQPKLVTHVIISRRQNMLEGYLSNKIGRRRLILIAYRVGPEILWAQGKTKMWAL
jgi:hypothetical protein